MNPGYGATGGMRSNTGSMREKIPSGYKKASIRQFTPEQMELFQSLFGHLGPDSYLSKLAGGDEETFAQMEAPALKQFQGVLGNLGSRFSGMGMGGRKSSGFQNATTSAASDFAQQLQSQRVNLQRQAIMDLLGLSHQLLGERPYENYLQKKESSSSGWGKIFGAGLGGLGGFLLGGPGGAMAGAKFGSDLGSGF